MTLFEIIILAIIQGVTEFLPISSSAHLLLPEVLLGWVSQGMAFDVAVHVGSLCAVVIYLREELIKLIRGFFSFGQDAQWQQEYRLSLSIIVATIPVIIVGFILKDWIEFNARTTAVMAATTIGFGLLLWLADAKGVRIKPMSQMKMHHALLIGVAQIMALIPGTSRSGVTMTAALFLGFDREAAARFSFLLSIPTILGAGLLSTIDLLNSNNAIDWFTLISGGIFSFISAYLCIYLFLSWISRLGMLPFVIYRLVLGAILLVFVFSS